MGDMVSVLMPFIVLLAIGFACGLSFFRELRDKTPPPSDGEKRTSRLSYVLGTLSVLVVLGAIVTPTAMEWLAMSPHGGELYDLGSMIFAASMLVCLMSIPFVFAGLFVKEARGWSLLLLLAALAALMGGIWSARYAKSIRQAGLEEFTGRSQTLIEAIKSYEAQHGRPPDSLEDLVPQFIAEVPTTGMSAYPEYDLYTGEAYEKEYCGNRWVLRVATPRGVINWDEMLYFPKQNYDEYEYRRSLEPVNDWMYFNE